MVCANIEQSRELFEAFASDNGKWMKAIERDANGNYRLLTTNAGWLWWQAADNAARQREMQLLIEIEALERLALANLKQREAAQAQRVPLSDAEICDALGIDGSDEWTYTVARAVEALHGITQEKQ